MTKSVTEPFGRLKPANFQAARLCSTSSHRKPGIALSASPDCTNTAQLFTHQRQTVEAWL